MNWRVTLLAITGAVQLAVPCLMIYEQEATLHSGKEFRLLTEPFDPEDAFRGRYVQLRFRCENIRGDGIRPAKMKTQEEWHAGDLVYVALKDDDAGFADVESVSKMPINGDNVIKAKVWSPPWTSEDGKAPVMVVHFPCDEFYMNEDEAQKAEEKYRKANMRNSNAKCWAVVRVRHGNAALVDVQIEGVSIRKQDK